MRATRQGFSRNREPAGLAPSLGSSTPEIRTMPMHGL
jgi:hypothetical protein